MSLCALPTLKPDSACLDQVAALAKDPDATVRAQVMSSYAFIRAANGIANDPIGEPALTLLSDKEKDVVVETARSLWGVPITHKSRPR
jgi:hypothetical protein